MSFYATSICSCHPDFYSVSSYSKEHSESKVTVDSRAIEELRENLHKELQLLKSEFSSQLQIFSEKLYQDNNLNAGGFQVVNLADCVNSTDAAPKSYVDNSLNALYERLATANLEAMKEVVVQMEQKFGLYIRNIYSELEKSVKISLKSDLTTLERKLTTLINRKK
jgi:hypothetical protein